LEDATSSVVDIVDYLIEEATKRRASDIHVEPQKDVVLIRIRIDGLLKIFFPFRNPFRPPDLSHKGHGQYGHHGKRLLRMRIKASFGKRRIDLRFRSSRPICGEGGPTAIGCGCDLHPLESMGATMILRRAALLIEKPQGVIFITAHWKWQDSTLYACLNHIKSENINITTWRSRRV